MKAASVEGDASGIREYHSGLTVEMAISDSIDLMVPDDHVPDRVRELSYQIEVKFRRGSQASPSTMDIELYHRDSSLATPSSEMAIVVPFAKLDEFEALFARVMGSVRREIESSPVSRSEEHGTRFEDYDDEGGTLHTLARVANRRAGVAASIRAYEHWPEQPMLELSLKGAGLAIQGALSDGIGCEIHDPRAVRDLGNTLLRVADQAERAGVFAALRTSRKKMRSRSPGTRGKPPRRA
jgi:hypothetical protein